MLVVLPGITSSRMRNTQEGCLFRQELPARGGIPLNNVDSTSSGTRNPPEEWNSAGNYQLIDKEFTRGMGFCQELLAH
jgi:hypothetical protein